MLSMVGISGYLACDTAEFEVVDGGIEYRLTSTPRANVTRRSSREQPIAVHLFCNELTFVTVEHGEEYSNK